MGFDKITLNAMERGDLSTFLKKYKPIMKCVICSRDIHFEDDIGGIRVRANMPTLICMNQECRDYTLKNAMEGPQ